MSETHQVAHHHLTLLHNGAEYFPRLLAAIHAATHSVYIETYIFANDECGRSLKAALESAAAREVEVHLLIDGFGSADFSSEWVDEMSRVGIRILKFRPPHFRLSLFKQHLRRLHRKLVVIDQRIAFVGGINVLAELNEPRFDYAVEIQGPVVADVGFAMRKLWQLVSWVNFRKSGSQGMKLVRSKATGSAISFLVRDNLRHRRDIEHAYLRAISQAQHEIILANAYFLPGLRFRRYLLHAAKRGVRVRLLLQGKVEYRLQHYATRALYDEMLRAGIEIYEYTQSYLHAKVAVIDGRWATVGSSNIDPFSLWLAREANLVVQDEGFASSLRTSLLSEMEEGAQAVAHDRWHGRSVWMRIALTVSYALVRTLVGLVGYKTLHDNI